MSELVYFPKTGNFDGFTNSGGSLARRDGVTPPEMAAEPGRHTTTSRADFAADFAAAVKAIRKLDRREPNWAVAAAATRERSAGRSKQPTHAYSNYNFQGRETTQQLSYKQYRKEDAPEAFRVTLEHRKHRDDYTEFVEAILRQRQLFGNK